MGETDVFSGNVAVMRSATEMEAHGSTENGLPKPAGPSETLSGKGDPERSPKGPVSQAKDDGRTAGEGSPNEGPAGSQV